MIVVVSPAKKLNMNLIQGLKVSEPYFKENVDELKSLLSDFDKNNVVFDEKGYKKVLSAFESGDYVGAKALSDAAISNSKTKFSDMEDAKTTNAQMDLVSESVCRFFFLLLGFQIGKVGYSVHFSKNRRTHDHEACCCVAFAAACVWCWCCACER